MSLNRINEITIGVLLFSPVLSYILVSQLGLQSTTEYFRIFIGAYGVMFIVASMIGKRSLVFPSFCWPLLFYSVYVLLWSLVNGEMQRRGLAKTLFHNINIQMLILFIVIYNTRFSSRYLRNCVRIGFVTVVLAFVVSLYQVYNPLFMNASLEKYGGNLGSLYTIRRSSIFGYTDENEIGLSFLPFLAIIVSWMIKNESKSYLVIVVLSGIISILTNTRYIMLSFLLILLMLVNHYRHHLVKRTRSILVGIVAIVIILGAASQLGYDFSDFYEERLLSEGSIDQTSRYLAFQTFFAYFGDHAFLGTGIRTFHDEEVYRLNAGRSSQIHVGYLDHLVVYGIVGSIFMFTFWLMIIARLRKTALRTGYWGSFYAFSIYLFANATLVNYSLFFYGLIFAFAFDSYYSSSLGNTAEVQAPIRSYRTSNPSI